MPKERVQDYALSIRNGGGAPLSYQLIEDVDRSWLSVTPELGSVEPGGTDTVTVTIDSGGLDSGSYAAVVVVDSDDPDRGRITVDVSLDIQAQPGSLRSIPSVASRGQVVLVNVTFSAPEDDFNAVGFTDYAPEGWDVRVDRMWCTPSADMCSVSGSGAEYLWNGPYEEGTGFTVIYELQVPGDAPLGTYAFPGGALVYYLGGAGAFDEDIAGGAELELIEGAVLSGLTCEVTGERLPGAKVEALMDGIVVGSAVSDESGAYGLAVGELGEYQVVASTVGFRDETQALEVDDPGREYKVDFIGETGLVPDAPDMSYVLTCINQWLYPPREELALSMSKLLLIVNAWLYPV